MRQFYLECPRKRRWFFTALVIHLAAAWFSMGFLHPDEYGQILLPLDLKLNGQEGVTGLPWEFADNARMRPWFQSALYYLPGKLLYWLNATPFFTAFFLRLITCLFSFFSLAWLGEKIFSNEGQQRQIWWCRLLALTWFLPVLQARAGSENLSAAFMFLSIGYLYKGLRLRDYGIGGLWAGISFLVRYQMGIVALSLFLWLLFIKRPKFRFLAYYCLAILLCLPIGVTLDYWGYGVWTFAPYNYFYHNIVLDKADIFGVMPWHFYFTESIKEGIPPVALLFLSAFFIFIYKRRHHILVAAVVPFLLVHSFIGHKELRFIVFVYFLSLVMVALVYNPWEWSKIKRRGAFFLVGLNLLALLPATLRPAHTSLPFHRFIYHKYTGEKTIFVDWKEKGGHLYLYKFYKRPSLKIQPVRDLQRRNGTLITASYVQFKVMGKRKNCRLERSIYPLVLLQDRYNYFNWLSRSSVWVLWECR